MQFPRIFSEHVLVHKSTQVPSSAYTLPHKYFVNCGSKININVTSRTFVGDLNSDSVSFTKKNSSVRDNSQSSGTPSLYQTARIFWQQSSYEFVINTDGTYLVRLHFFNSSGLPAAVFDVSASGFILLHNFTVQNSSSFPLIEEFILSIPIGKFFIYFVPQGSSFAFVNAIEVFPAPPNFIYDEATQISQGNRSDEYKGILSRALKTIHRINVGGQTLTPENDTLFRTWLPDDNYLYNPDTAKNSQFYAGRPNYIDPVNEFIAPDLVYKTAKEMNINTSRASNNFNITWSYDVTSNAKHLIRVHFCDIVSQSQNVLQFFLYINSNFVQEINPFEKVRSLATPFFIDFVVDSDDSGLMNISIGPDTSLTQNQTAFLNGVEIMELMGESDLVPISNESNQKPIFIIVGSAIGGLVLVCILGGLLFMVLKRRKPKAVETSNWTPLNAYRGSTHSNEKMPQLSTLSTEGTVIASPKGLLEQIVDPSIKVQINPNSLRKFAEIAEKCLREDGDDRPTMGDVVWDLEYALQLQQTAVVREPHEDSTSNASSILPFPILQRFPSMSAELGGDDMSITREDDSDSVPTASGVFSQLRINDAR
ncbi:hypothetical protein QUC31_003172 [Theobroma cacao]